MDAGKKDGGPGPVVTTCNPSAAPTIPALRLRALYTGIGRLVFAAQPKGTSDWYLVRQSGQILVSKSGAAPESTPFLDVSNQIKLNDAGDEWGLLGLAFAPDYATSGKLYVTLTPTEGDDAWQDMVIEYQRSAADPYRVDPSTKRVLSKLEVSTGNHNGGHVAFGPDGLLYVGTGDGGGSCNDNKEGAPQDRKQLFGKILRLDPSAPPPHAAAGNPFSGDVGDPRVLHYGLRNPYRFALDPVNGDLFIGDVGQSTEEEISFAPQGAKGLNFGWAAYEGNATGTCPNRPLASGTTYTPPVFSANRKGTGLFSDYVSIIAGPVYRGSAIPQLAGAFIFGDYQGDRMGLFYQCGTATSPVAIIRKRKDANSTEAGFAAPSGGEPFALLTAIVEDSNYELYFVANQDTLLKVEPTP